MPYNSYGDESSRRKRRAGTYGGYNPLAERLRDYPSVVQPNLNVLPSPQIVQPNLNVQPNIRPENPFNAFVSQYAQPVQFAPPTAPISEWATQPGALQGFNPRFAPMMQALIRMLQARPTQSMPSRRMVR